MPFARAWLVSSVLSVEDYHARCHDEGDTAFQNVECGSTWDLNPQLTREDCLALESDPRVFDREYGAIPSASLAGAFDPAHCVNAFRALPNGCRYYPAIGVLDTAAGKRVGSDKMTWGRFQIAELPAPPEFLTRLVPRRNHCRIGGADVILDDPYERISDYERDANGLPRRNPEFSNARTPVLALTGIDSVGGVFHEGLVDGSLWKRIGQFFHWGGVHDVYGDGYGGPQTHKELRRFGIRYHELRWDNEAKSKAVYRLRHLMASGALYLQQHEQLRAELLSYQEKISPSGVVSYAGRGATKDDHVSLLLNAAMVEHERALPGSPLYQQRTRHEVKLTGGSENIF
jgi:hypothetical protein